ncbi:MAG TPA: hypothetical protein VND93_29765 [Myxococcales bacterium]|nr:hypothetical protein [Myxococcales bacterium]
MPRLSLRSLLATLPLLAACGPAAPAPGPDPQLDTSQSEQGLCAQPQYLQNSSFQNVGPLGSSTSVTLTVPGGAGASAAANWTLFMNVVPGTIRTNLQAPSLIHVYTTQPGGGLVQVFGPYGSGPTKIIAKAMVYVVRGQVAIGTGNGGGTQYDAFSTTTGAWELISAGNGVIPANEFIIYATSAGGAEFYVDSATVEFSPNLLYNPTFANAGPSGSYTDVTTVVPGTAGNSAASNWTLFTNNPGRIISRLEPSTLSGMVNMIHVLTWAPANGLVQVFGGSLSCTANGPAHTDSGAWVYVRSGEVSIGTGNGGATGYDRHSTTTGAWEWLEAPNGVSPANEFIVYASSTAGADYYVGFARVNEIP